MYKRLKIGNQKKNASFRQSIQCCNTTHRRSDSEDILLSKNKCCECFMKITSNNKACFLASYLKERKNHFREGSLNFFWTFLALKVIFTDNSVISHPPPPHLPPQPQLTDKRVKWYYFKLKFRDRIKVNHNYTLLVWVISVAIVSNCSSGSSDYETIWLNCSG